jgi:hypothetical protein
MIRPNPSVAAMAAYAMPDVTGGSEQQPIVLAQSEHTSPPSVLIYGCLAHLELDAG